VPQDVFVLVKVTDNGLALLEGGHDEHVAAGAAAAAAGNLLAGVFYLLRHHIRKARPFLLQILRIFPAELPPSAAYPAPVSHRTV
jgi:hypothetical protein